MEIDDSLRDLFHSEGEKMLEQFADGLRRLAENPGDTAAATAAFHAMHQLKGSAQILGMKELGRAAAQIESTLRTAAKDGGSLTPEAIQQAMQAGEQIRKQVLDV